MQNSKIMLVDISRVFFSSAFVQAIGAVRSFILPALMIPEQLGVWNLFNVIVGYGANSHAGLLHGMNKILPQLISDAELDKRERIKDSVLWVTMIFAFLFSIFASTYSHIYLGYSFSNSVILGAVITGQSVYIYYLCLLRSDCNFKLFSWSSAVYSTLLTSLVLLFVFLFDDKVAGAIFGLMISQFLVCFFLFGLARYSFKLRIERSDIYDSFRTGLPIIFIGILDMMLLTFDRWVISWRFSDHELGIYVFATIFSAVIGSIPVAVGQVLYPLLLKHKSESQLSDAENLAITAAPVVSLCVALIAISLYLFLPYVINLNFEKYNDSIEVAQVLIPGSFFLSLTHIAGTYIIAVDQQNKLPPLQILSLTFGTGFSLLFLSIYPTLVSVAYGVLVMYIIYGIGYLFLAQIHASSSLFSAGKFCMKIIIPYSLAISLSGLLVSYSQMTLYQSVVLYLLLSAALILCYSVIFKDNYFFRFASAFLSRRFHN